MTGLNEIKAKLSAHKDELRTKYRIKEIGISLYFNGPTSTHLRTVPGLEELKIKHYA